jgi:hypothetical protein
VAHQQTTAKDQRAIHRRAWQALSAGAAAAAADASTGATTAAAASAERSAHVLDMLLSELHGLCVSHAALGGKGRQLRDWAETALAALRTPTHTAVAAGAGGGGGGIGSNAGSGSGYWHSAMRGMTEADRVVFWTAALHVAAHERLPAGLDGRLGYVKEPAALDWTTTVRSLPFAPSIKETSAARIGLPAC